MAHVPDPTRVELDRALEAALDDLYRLDRDVLGTTERVVVGRLLIYLERHLASWLQREPGDGRLNLDQEYERFAGVTKVLRYVDCEEGRKISPDLVLHRRRSNAANANLLAIEVKVRNETADRLHDLAKLSVLTGCSSALVYDSGLRICPDAALGEPIATVGLPREVNGERMTPYRYGLWLLVTGDRAADERLRRWYTQSETDDA